MQPIATLLLATSASALRVAPHHVAPRLARRVPLPPCMDIELASQVAQAGLDASAAAPAVSASASDVAAQLQEQFASIEAAFRSSADTAVATIGPAVDALDQAQSSVRSSVDAAAIALDEAQTIATPVLASASQAASTVAQGTVEIGQKAAELVASPPTASQVASGVASGLVTAGKGAIDVTVPIVQEGVRIGVPAIGSGLRQVAGAIEDPNAALASLQEAASSPTLPALPALPTLDDVDAFLTSPLGQAAPYAVGALLLYSLIIRLAQALKPYVVPALGLAAAALVADGALRVGLVSAPPPAELAAGLGLGLALVSAVAVGRDALATPPDAGVAGSDEAAGVSAGGAARGVGADGMAGLRGAVGTKEEAAADQAAVAVETRMPAAEAVVTHQTVAGSADTTAAAAAAAAAAMKGAAEAVAPTPVESMSEKVGAKVAALRRRREAIEAGGHAGEAAAQDIIDSVSDAPVTS